MITFVSKIIFYSRVSQATFEFFQFTRDAIYVPTGQVLLKICE